MSRTLADLTAGAIVYLRETVSGTETYVPFYYLGLDDNNNARLLRKCAWSTAIKMHASAVASYAGCYMDTWLENTYLGYLDSDVQNALVNTAIKYVDYNQSGDGTAEVLEISRRCFLMSYSEMGYGNDAAGNEGTSFQSALNAATSKTEASARIAYNANGTAVSTWLRSAYSASNFRYVNAGGGAGSSGATYTGYYPRPALSVDSSTIVSDEGAETIYLLPSGTGTTWDVEMEMSLGELAARPAQAKVTVPVSSDITSVTVQVCNNYGDATPTWQTVTNGGVVTLTNTTKETTNWEVGIKVTGVGSVPTAYIGEPVAIVACDS